MRPFIVVMVGLLAISPNDKGDASETAATKSSVVKSMNATAEMSNRGFGPWEVNPGYIVDVDEKTNSFDLRASDGLIQARNPEWLVIMDRQGALLPSMTLSTLKERHYYVTVKTGAPEAGGSFKFFFTVEALP